MAAAPLVDSLQALHFNGLTLKDFGFTWCSQNNKSSFCEQVTSLLKSSSKHVKTVLSDFETLKEIVKQKTDRILWILF